MNKGKDLSDLTLIEVASGIRKGTFSSEEVTRHCLTRINQAQPILNCFISIDEESAIKSAQKADKKVTAGDKLGVLHGVPLAHKDMFYKKGIRSTGGSKIQKDFIPSYTSTVINRLAVSYTHLRAHET